jgi:hypothetical protein
LNDCIGRPAKEVVRVLNLKGCKWYWVDEPPGVLRGVCYHPGEDREVTLYIAQGEPLFRRFDKQREWNYRGFLNWRVGGIQYYGGKVWLDIGPAVPCQLRRPATLRKRPSRKMASQVKQPHG